MIKQILNFLNKNRKILIFFLGVFLFFHFIDLSFADNANWTTTVTHDNNKISDKIKAANLFFIFIASFLWTITELVGLFLNPSWTTGSVFWISEKLHDLWILVSNLVYFIFMLILLAIAFMNIIWQWKWVFELKQALPRLIIWILMVPLSWLLVSWVVSIASSLTASVITLPFESFKNTTAIQQLEKTNICISTDIWNLNWHHANPWEYKAWGENKQWTNAWDTTILNNWDNQVVLSCKQTKSIKEIMDSPNWAFWILNFYTYWVMAIDEKMKVFSNSLWDKVDSLFSVLWKIWFDWIFIIIYFILVAALFLALFVRWIRLWIFMVFSPIFWLFFFFWKDWVWENKEFSIKELISLALVPVYVAWALSFWLLFIVVIWEWIWSWNANLFSVYSTPDDWITTLNILWTFDLTIHSDFSWISDKKNIKSFEQVIWWWLWMVWWIIMNLFWLIVLWIAIITALKQSKITWAIIKPIADFGSQVWDLMKSVPKYIPIPWTNISFEWLSNLPSTINSTMSSRAKNSWSALWAEIWWKFADIIWLQWNKTTKSLENMAWRLKEINLQLKNNNFQKAANILRESLAKVTKDSWYKNLEEFMKKDRAWYQTAISTIWNNIEWLTEEQIKKIQDSTSKTQLDQTIREIAQDHNTNEKIRSLLDSVDWKFDKTISSFTDAINGEIKSIPSSGSESSSSSRINNILNAKVEDHKIKIDNNEIGSIDDSWKIKNNTKNNLIKAIKNKNFRKESEIENELKNLNIHEDQIKEIVKEVSKNNNNIVKDITEKWREQLKDSILERSTDVDNNKITIKIWEKNNHSIINVKNWKVSPNEQKAISDYFAKEKSWALKNAKETDFREILSQEMWITDTNSQNEIINEIKKNITNLW